MIMVVIYLLIFLIVGLESCLFFHSLAVIYLCLLIWVIYMPYFKIRNNKIKSSGHLFKSMDYNDIIEVILINDDYVFRMKNCKIFIGNRLIDEADNKRLLKFLKERNLLSEVY